MTPPITEEELNMRNKDFNSISHDLKTALCRSMKIGLYYSEEELREMFEKKFKSYLKKNGDIAEKYVNDIEDMKHRIFSRIIEEFTDYATIDDDFPEYFKEMERKKDPMTGMYLFKKNRKMYC